MLAKILGSKWLISGTAIVVVVASMAGLYVVGSGLTGQKEYCAEFDDAIGLFPGNHVTRRGVTIGTITDVEPGRGAAIVRFTADGAQQLPAEVKAATVAPSVIAVRQLALIGDDTGGEALAADECIPKTATNTPVSISESLESISTVAKQLTTAGGPDELQNVLQFVGNLDKELEGTGPELNSLINDLAEPGNSPMAGALVDTARVVDNVSAMSTGLAGNWEFLEDFITEITGVIEPLVLPTIDEVVRIIGAVPETIQLLTKVVSHYGHFVWPALDVVVPIARLIGNGMRNFGDILGIVPVLIRAFDISFDQQSLGLRIRYTPPTTRIPAQNPELTCANINRLVPGQCTVTDPDGMEIDAITMALMLTGAKP
ncbi:MlaD family protein [Gordonia sp. PKS22-38]|uniref:MlaD family protein n=1 Tax=Gordonia prachuapensis TaxID=3115651 RepID=A0ABU7MMR8_9ACTN|nr:MlaD family protein [Gordonia sp. PKS22-38]